MPRSRNLVKSQEDGRLVVWNLIANRFFTRGNLLKGARCHHVFLCHLETSNRNNQQKLVYLVEEENDTIYKFSSLTRTQISEVQCGRNGRG